MAAIQGQPSFTILACLIEIWDQKDPNAFAKEPDNPAMVITEVEEIEINDNYKQLISKASVKFPRGTIVRRTVTIENLDDNHVSADLDDAGVLVTTRTSTKRASVEDFKIGQRIRIHLGYIYEKDSNVFDYLKPNVKQSVYNSPSIRAKYITAMAPTAPNAGSSLRCDGYSTQCSIDEPIEIQCENAASKLKKKSCPEKRAVKDMTIQDIFGEKGWNLLDKTGIKLHPECDKIDLGRIHIPKDRTVADILTGWAQKESLYSFIRPDNDGNPCLMIGRAYFSNPGKDAIDDINGLIEIDFAYHVANNNLTMADTDKDFLAVTASCWETAEGRGKKYSITIRRNPEYDPSDASSEEYQVLNETTLSKKAQKAGATKLTNTKDRVDLSTYNIVPYFSKKIGISHNELKQEAIKYFESIRHNGVEGTLTLFGDFNMRSATKVHLKDDRFPAKNGYYFVDEVTTKFGVSGYRQTIKLPHCISRDKQENDS